MEDHGLEPEDDLVYVKQLAAEDLQDLSDDELMTLAWEHGDLRILMHDGQIKLHDHMQQWRLIDQLEGVHEDGSIPLIYAIAGGKRFGKTSLILWMAHSLGVWFYEQHGRAATMRLTSAFQKNIDEIVGSVLPQCFRTAPDSCAPVYHGKRGILPAGLYWPEDGPTGGMRLALAGIDKNPDALRGQANDFDFISEAAFIDNLEYTVRNVLIHQYQGRPWARMFIETSAPEDVDTDWERVIMPDAKSRGAFSEVTIEDNTRLTRRQKDFYISMAGGRGAPNCEREFFNVIAGDPTLKAVPEFNKEQHVRGFERPKYAYGFTAADPGQTHLFALVWGEYDFDNDRLLILDSWAKSNAGSMEVAAVCAAREFVLWGRWPDPRMRRVPLQHDGQHLGWRDLLRGDKYEKLAPELHRMATLDPAQRPIAEKYPGFHITNPIPGAITPYYDRQGFHLNPHARVSDVDKQLIRDIDDHYGLEFQATSKEELVTMLRNLRNWVAEGRLWFAPDAGCVIDHVTAGKRDKRGKLAEHKVYGHFDCIAEGSLIKTARGDIPIEQVVPGDMVWTRKGLRAVTATRDVGEREVWKLESAGCRVEATGDHKVWTENRGFVRLHDLLPSDALCEWESSVDERRLCSTDAPTVVTQTQLSAITTCISPREMESCFTETFGSSITATSLAAWTFITGTAIPSTTTSRASSFCPAWNMPASTVLSLSAESACALTRETWSDPLGSLGAKLQQAWHSVRKTSSNWWAALRRRSTPSNACSVGTPSWLRSIEPSSAAAGAWPKSVVIQAPTTSPEHASFAGTIFAFGDSTRPRTARAAVHSVTGTRSKKRVFDITVDEEHEFFANGILVSNCLAALVYMVRRVELSTNARPHPPTHIMTSFPEGATIIDRLPWVPKQPHEVALEEAQKMAHGLHQRGRMKLYNGGRR